MQLSDKWRYWGILYKPFETLLFKLSKFNPLKGVFPDNISYKIHPSDQISTLLLYKEPFNISGAIYKGVPQ